MRCSMSGSAFSELCECDLWLHTVSIVTALLAHSLLCALWTVLSGSHEVEDVAIAVADRCRPWSEGECTVIEWKALLSWITVALLVSAKLFPLLGTEEQPIRLMLLLTHH